MKKTLQLEVPFPYKSTFLCLFFSIIIHQNTFSQNVKKLGNVSSFLNYLSTQKRSGKQEKIIQTPDTSFAGSLNILTTTNNKNLAIGELKDFPGSNFYFNISDQALEGKVIIPALEKAYEYYSDATATVFVKEVDINKVVCINFTEPTLQALTVSPSQAPASISQLQSFPEGLGVILLDFDGQHVEGTYWNGGKPIDAAPTTLSEEEIYEVWKLVSEDYRPFNINITTDESVYLKAPEDKRMRCIFTPTATASPGAGGIAYIGSFNWGTETPCWVFNGGIKGAGEAASHEIGHTLGLGHDGRTSPQEEYYTGTEDWAPIMGVGYYSKTVQWSKGEYMYANNLQDDISTISDISVGIGFRTDESENGSEIKHLVYSNSGIIDSTLNSGVIASASDQDIYLFSTSGGAVKIYITPSPDYPDLDIYASITDTLGNIIIASSPTESLSASIIKSLPQGKYYLTIDGTGNGAPLATGYSDYGSIGLYFINGNIITTPRINKMPSAAIITPSTNKTYLAPTLDIIANAVDSDGAITKVEFFNGVNKLGEDSTAPYSITLKNIVPGTLKLTVKATDNEGATSISEMIQVNVKAPFATVFQHCNFNLSGYAIGLDTGSYTLSKLISLGMKDNEISGAKVSDGYEIILYKNDKFLGASLALRANTPCLYDNKFNDSTSSLLIRQIPNIAPVIAITSPKEGEKIIAGTDLNIIAEGNDPDGVITEVNFYKDTEKVFSTTTSPYSYTIKSIVAGSYNFKVIAKDNKGASDTSTVSITVITPELPVGINGPSCIEPAQTYYFTLKPETNTTNVNWWSSGDAQVIRDGKDYNKVKVTFTPYNNSTVILYAGVNYSVAPFYKEYNKIILLGGCTKKARTAVYTNPHPFISSTNISVSNGEKILSVKIFNLQGQEIYSTNQLNTESFELGENLSQGVYLLNVVTETGTFTRTIFKN